MATSKARLEPPLVVIIGPTASGKTGLAIELARRYGGEVICADSRTVYRGMDIGTAKPSLVEQAGVPHWGLDLATPDVRYTASQFQAYAQEKIAEIRKRGRIPFLVGGTGLYIDSVVFKYTFPRPLHEDERTAYTNMSKEELYKYCIKNNIELPIDDKNKRRLVHSIETVGQQSLRRAEPIHNTIIVGITTDRHTLRERIGRRTEQMFQHGVVEESIILGKKYGWARESMTGNVYKMTQSHLEGRLSLDELKDKITTKDVQLAKRQMTWFRRNPFIEWCQLSEVNDYLGSRLATEYNL